jgi:hypothetical protein
MGNADLSGEAWCSVVTRWYGVFLEPLAEADVWSVEEKQIYEMLVLLLIILPGKRD